MTARVLKGSKQEIARQVASLEGDVREAIVFIEQPPGASTQRMPESVEEMFKEMEPYMVNVGNVDYSREAIYSTAGPTFRPQNPDCRPCPDQ